MQAATLSSTRPRRSPRTAAASRICVEETSGGSPSSQRTRAPSGTASVSPPRRAAAKVQSLKTSLYSRQVTRLGSVSAPMM